MTIEAEINGWLRNGQLDGLLQITVCDRLSHDALHTAAQPRLQKRRQCAAAACYAVRNEDAIHPITY